MLLVAKFNSYLSPSRARIQIQGNTTKSDNVNYSKSLELKVKLPNKHPAWPLNYGESWSCTRQCIKIFILKSKKSTSTTPNHILENL